MATVPDNLVPQDGLTNSQIKFSRFDAAGSGAILYFTMTDEEGTFVGQFQIEVHPSKQTCTIDELVAHGHRKMANVLRQWLYETDISARVYEERVAQLGQR